MYKVIVLAGLLWAGAAPWSYAQATDPNAAPCQVRPQDPNALDAVLQALQGKAAELKSYQTRVDYLFKQPLLESQQRRKGTLTYAKFGNRSYLRVDFTTLQQDEEKEQKYGEQYFFDGVWLTTIDDQLKTVERRQLAEPNKPLDAFALASRQLPVLGFSNVQDLRQQFDIQLVPDPRADAASVTHLHLKVKPDSVYKDDYVTVDFWVDKKVGLPRQVVAVTTEDDVHEIRLVEPKVNAPLERNVFQPGIPRGFAVDVIPLDRQKQKN
jgi:outer membrane lipoprotein-sorting protein